MSTPTRSAVLARCSCPRRLLAPPRVPRAGEEERAAGLELEHRRRHRLEEPAVVRDEDDRRRRATAAPARATRGLDVEVVRRLVEQQQVGVARERARQRGTRELAARERVERPVEVATRRSRARAVPGRALAPVVAARVLEPRLGLGVAPQRRRRRGRRPPSPARAARSSSSVATRSAAPESAYSRKLRPALRAAGAGRAARCACPSRTRARRRAPRSRRRASGAGSSCRRRSGRRARAGRGARPRTRRRRRAA